MKQNQNVLYCTDIKCKSIHHRNGIDKLCKCIIDSCLDAGNATIPHTRTNDKTMPGWSDKTKDEREYALFWHWIWCEAGRPYSGNNINKMNHTSSMLSDVVDNVNTPKDIAQVFL